MTRVESYKVVEPDIFLIKGLILPISHIILKRLSIVTVAITLGANVDLSVKYNILSKKTVIEFLQYIHHYYNTIWIILY